MIKHPAKTQIYKVGPAFHKRGRAVFPRLVLSILSGSFLVALAMSAQISSLHAEESKLESDIQKASYGVGTKYGEGLKRDLSDLDLQAFIKGVQDAFAGKKLALTPEELNKAVTAYQQRKMTEAKTAFAEKAQKNLASGQAFLAENGKRKGVKVTESGLQYEVLKEGSGKKPGAEDQVKVHYHGTLIDGTVFDSSVDRGEPMVFPVNGVIKGWTEALQMMAVGSKWKVFIPAELAYGERGTRGVIGPNAALIFEVELLDVES